MLEKPIQVNSEIGKLNAVILHSPGQEVANMTPGNAEKALYSDILNLPITLNEHNHFEEVLKKVSKTYQLKDLLIKVLENNKVKNQIINDIYINVNLENIIPSLYEMNPISLSSKIIEGLEIQRNTLTNFISNRRYAIQPLHNFFFMRDASVSIGNEVLISNMAGKVRQPESIIMDAIFKYHHEFGINTINIPNKSDTITSLIEGGDVHIAREDVLLMGMGARSNSQGIDSLINYYNSKKIEKHIIVQELPLTPESFIHLDMVFTILDIDKCMIYEPVILKNSNLKTIYIHIKDGKVDTIKERTDILVALEEIGMPMKPIICGGTEPWNQEREQWHSGANFFSFAPGKILGYARNIYTIEQLSLAGFEVIKATDVISGKVHPDDFRSCVVTVEGSELARGGGGARCMTMPIHREEL